MPCELILSNRFAQSNRMHVVTAYNSCNLQINLSRAIILRAALTLLLILFSVDILAVNGFQFNYPNFLSDRNDLNLSAMGDCVKEPYAYYISYDVVSPNFTASYLQLMPMKNGKSLAVEEVSSCSVDNRVIYNHPIPFLSEVNNKPMAVSFSTSFQFQLLTHNKSYGHSRGMTFFISSSSDDPLLTDSSSFQDPLLAIRFLTDGDEFKVIYNYSHILVDMGSVDQSIGNVADIDTALKPELNLHSNYTFNFWMRYNSSSQKINVWMTSDTTSFNLSSADPPISTDLLSRPLASLQIHNELSSFFKPYMFVGFTAEAQYGADNDLQIGSTDMAVNIFKWFFSVEQTSNITSSDSAGSPANPTSTKSSKPSENSHANSNSLQLKFIVPLVAIGLLLLASVASCLAFLLYSRKKSKSESPNPQQVNVNRINLPRYSYRQLQDCTHNFNAKTSLIGEGGFSKVYKGVLEDGSIVAIKRLKEGLRMEAEFSKELKIISNIRHRNLLQLQGWAYENGEAFLVYRFMRNGSLETYIYGSRKGTLDGATRLRILAGVASALEYLHDGLGECILHRDVKAANVLLTDDFEPVLGDFGLARFIEHNQVVTATRAGTPGFIAPEVLITGKVTDKVDVYSFGVLMLEVASGSQAINIKALEQSGREIYLVEWVRGLNNINNFQEVIDSSILKLAAGPLSEVEEQWKQVIELSLMCCHLSPEDRPDMKHVRQRIQEIITDPQNTVSTQWKTPATLDQQYQYYDYLGMLNLNQPDDPSKSPDPTVPILVH